VCLIHWIAFDSLDRVQHMFWRDRQDIIENWYTKLDGLVGRVEEAIQAKGLDKVRLLVVSDHGFANFDKKVHLNRWLIDKGFLVSENDKDSGKIKDVDWTRVSLSPTRSKKNYWLGKIRMAKMWLTVCQRMLKHYQAHLPRMVRI